MIGIITGTEKVEFVDIGSVTIKLTRKERWELLVAYIKYSLKGFKPSLADCMSPELESLLCGGRPERYMGIT